MALRRKRFSPYGKLIISPCKQALLCVRRSYRKCSLRVQKNIKNGLYYWLLSKKVCYCHKKWLRRGNSLLLAKLSMKQKCIQHNPPSKHHRLCQHNLSKIVSSSPADLDDTPSKQVGKQESFFYLA